MSYSSRVNQWKRQGMTNDDWKTIYDRYVNAKCCESCNSVFRKNIYKNGYLWRINNKVLDHDHNTGKIRNVICISCNAKRRYIDEKVYQKNYEKKREVDMGGYMANDK